MRYAIFDGNGKLIYRLVKGLHTMPPGAIPISEEVFSRSANEEDGIWMLVNGEVVKMPLPAPAPPTLDDLKAAKLQEINADFTIAAQALTDGYPEAERLTWPVQQQEALAWNANPSSPTSYLDGLADARGITAEEMRQKTFDQTTLFMQASQAIVGKRQRLRDSVYAALTPEDVIAISWQDLGAPQAG